jgi:hypothetical protein
LFFGNKKITPFKPKSCNWYLSAGFLARRTLSFAFPAFLPVAAIKDTTPTYSGGTAPAFNWIPFSERWVFDFQVNVKKLN